MENHIFKNDNLPEPTDDYCTSCNAKNSKNDEGDCAECIATDQADNHMGRQYEKRQQEASLDEMENTIEACKILSAENSKQLKYLKIQLNAINKLKS